MARYFFHLVENDQRIVDEIGVDLPNADAALQEAELGARDILAEEMLKGDKVGGIRIIEVADESGLTLATVSFDEVLARVMLRRGVA